MLRIAVSPLVAAVALGLLHPSALDVEEESNAERRFTEAREHAEASSDDAPSEG
jgi:hypothetical protein